MTNQTESATEAIRITPAQKTYVHALQIRHGLETVRQAMQKLIDQDRRCERAKEYKRKGQHANTIATLEPGRPTDQAKDAPPLRR